MKKRIFEFLVRLLGESTFFSLYRYFLFLFRKDEREYYELIKKNIKIKNRYYGKSCFILGNGPSLKKIDLKKLGNKYVFTTNFFSKVKDYSLANSNFHFLIDEEFYNESSLLIDDIISNYKELEKTVKVFFLPVYAKTFIEKNKVLKNTNIFYLWPFKEITGQGMNDIDLTKPMYGYTTVVQYAIQTAIFMGFTKIYLLGCDSTNIVSEINTIIGNKDNDLHAYEAIKQNEGIKKWNTYEMLYDQYLLFRGYKYLNEYCKKIGVSLYNCSNPTLITEIEQIDFDSIV